MVDGVWQKAAERIRASLGQVAYETWISPLDFIDLHGCTATIEAPNRFFRDWVKDRYLDLMQQVLSTEVGGSVEISLTVREDAGRDNGANGNGGRNSNDRPSKGVATATVATAFHVNEAERSPLHPELNPRFTFAEFVVGSSKGFLAYRPENHHFRLREFAIHTERRTSFVNDEARKPAINSSGVEVLALNAVLAPS